MKIIFTFLFFASIISQSFAQAGSPDNTFGTNGKVITAIGAGNDFGRAIAIQSDGKIVEAGTSNNGTNNDFALARFSAAGVPDNTFGTNGKVITAIGTSDDEANVVALQSDGKIIAAGFTFNGADRDFALTRYNADGSLDNTFGTGGKVITAISTTDENISAIAIQSDGKIVVGGFSNTTIIKSDFTLVRYNNDGTLDNTFGTGGIVTTAIGTGNDGILALAIQNDGMIVASGYTSGANYSSSFAIARYTPNGIPDVTFGTGGNVTTSFVTDGNSDAYAVAIQSDGKIVAAGDSANSEYITFALVRYNSNGTLDNTFGGDGKVTTAIGTLEDYVRGIGLQSDGKIVVGGITLDETDFTADLALARYNTDGTLDNSFDGDGKATLNLGGNDNITAMTLSGNHIYLGGSTNANGTNDFALAAFQNDATALPLSLTSFAASKQNTSVQLSWKIAREQNTSSFEIERSTDGQSFRKIGDVNASGASMTERAYSFTDDIQFLSHFTSIFYRLKMVDADGKFTYSPVMIIKVGAIVKGLQIFSNPVKDVLHVQVTGANETAILQVTDAAGRVLKQEKLQLNGTASISLNLQFVAKGNYYLLMQTKDKKEVLPFVKQ